MTAPLPPERDGFRDIAPVYDGLICDVWGVVHNGQMPFAGAVDALRRFRAQHGPVVLLTNAPRLAEDVKAQLARIGVPPDCYDAIVTSGEATRADLARRATASAPLAVFKLGPERDSATWEGLNLRFVEPEEAELVLCTGLFNDEVETPADYRDLLARCKFRDLAFLCANPDVTVRRGDALVYCAGALARVYETLGGEVVYFGKPYGAIFDVARASLNAVKPVARPLVIGDGLATDLRGANDAGLDVLFIAGGVVGAEIGELPRALAESRLAELFAAHGVHAVARMQQLAW
jgi:HAD superfamily hydrolase (TIGR01459 family)